MSNTVLSTANVNVMNNNFSMQREAQPSIFSAQFGAFNNKAHERVTVEDAIKQAKADYKVSKKHIVALTDEQMAFLSAGEVISDFNPHGNIITSHKATVREDTDKVLGIVGKDYGIVQNDKAFEFVNFLDEVSGGDFTIETAGALGYGERMYVSCKLGKDCYLDNNGKDKVEMYVVFTNSHDGSGAVQVFFTPTRVVCRNTLNFAIKKAQNKLTFKHTSRVNERLNWQNEENRRKALIVFEKSVNFSDEFKMNMLFLRNEQVNESQIKDFVASVFLDGQKFNLYLKANRIVDNVDEISTRAKNQMDALRTSIENGIGQDEYRGSKLWLLNGLTTMYQNDKNWKSNEDKLNSIMGGTALKKVQNAYEYLMAV